VTTAPLSPPNVSQWIFPVGFGGGSAPGKLYMDPGYIKEVFASVWVQVKTPWQDPNSGTTELIRLQTDAPLDVTLEMMAAGGSPAHRADVINTSGTRLSPNQTTTDLSLGT
jgi:hypothetical protein